DPLAACNVDSLATPLSYTKSLFHIWNAEMDIGASAARHYAGPVIDAHHHFWDLGLGKHGWLDSGWPDYALQPLRRDYLPNDYLRDRGGEEVVASVHVEANWDPADPFGETQWLDRLVRPPGIAERYVVYAALGTEGAAAHLE